MKTIQTLFYLTAAAVLLCGCLLCGCTKEVQVTAPRDISAEYPSDSATPKTAKLVFLDGIDDSLTGAQIANAVKENSADIIFLATNGSIDGLPVAQYLKKNCSSWGHTASFSAGGNGCTTSLSGVTADSLDIYVSGLESKIFLKLKVCGYNFVCGNVINKNSIHKVGKSTIMENTVIYDGLARWVVLCHAWWEDSTPWDISQYCWPAYGYNEAVFFKEGKDYLPQRRDFAFLSEGLLNAIQGTQNSPIRFSFNIVEE